MSQNSELERNKAKIMNWLMEDGFIVQERPNADAQFHLVAESPSHIKFDIVHPTNMRDKVILGAGVLLTNDRKQKLDVMKLEDKLALFWNLRFDILKSGGVAFINLDHASDRYGLQSIVYYDGLNKNIFMDKLHHLHDIMLYLLMTFDKEFGQPSPSQDLGMFG